MRRSTLHIAGFVAAVLGIVLITGFVAHVHGEAVSTGTQSAVPAVVVTGTRLPVRTAITVRTATRVPTLAPTAPPTPVDDLALPAAATDAPIQRAVQTPTPATATPTGTAISSIPGSPSSEGVWMTLDTYTQTPGNWTLHLRGGGFAAREQVDLRSEGAAGITPAHLVADEQGGVDGSASVQIPPGAPSTLSLLAEGAQSGRQASASIGVLPYTPTLSLAPYAAWPGQSVDVSAQGFPPNVSVRLTVGGTVIRTVHADGGGTVQIHAAFTVPYRSVAGHVEVVAASTVGHLQATQTLDVLALQPWATASAYAVHAGDRVQFDAHGFAAGELVKVYLGERYLGQSASPTDGQGNAGGIGPFTVPADDPQPTYSVVGARSGTQVMVTLTVLP